MTSDGYTLRLASSGWWVEQSRPDASDPSLRRVLIGEGSGATTMTRERAHEKAVEVAADLRDGLLAGLVCTVRAVRVDADHVTVEASEGVTITGTNARTA